MYTCLIFLPNYTDQVLGVVMKSKYRRSGKAHYRIWDITQVLEPQLSVFSGWEAQHQPSSWVSSSLSDNWLAPVTGLAMWFNGNRNSMLVFRVLKHDEGEGKPDSQKQTFQAQFRPESDTCQTAWDFISHIRVLLITLFCDCRGSWSNDRL